MQCRHLLTAAVRRGDNKTSSQISEVSAEQSVYDIYKTTAALHAAVVISYAVRRLLRDISFATTAALLRLGALLSVFKTAHLIRFIVVQKFDCCCCCSCRRLTFGRARAHDNTVLRSTTVRRWETLPTTTATSPTPRRNSGRSTAGNPCFSDTGTKSSRLSSV